MRLLFMRAEAGLLSGSAHAVLGGKPWVVGKAQLPNAQGALVDY
ncbi:hypothetical protein [Limnohabitans sp. DM1]|nr:hypothetical protein [Limnohabitans sp. DM1]